MSVLSPSGTRRDPKKIADRERHGARPSPKPPSRMGRAFDERCRKVVLRRFKSFRVGRLRLIEADEEIFFGPGGGDEPSVAIRVHDSRFYRSLVLGGSIGAGEAYFLGYWSTDDLVGVLRFFCRNMTVTNRLQRGLARLSKPMYRLVHRMRPNTIAGALRNIAAHYDLGNEFYSCFLDKTMSYSSGIFLSRESTLEDASVEKLDRICRRLRLRETDRVIDIGCGWGGFALHAATNYGCHVTGITISNEQYERTKRLVSEKGLDDRIAILLKDYRHVTGKFDKLISIEMIENVGRTFLDTFFKSCSDLLKPDGAMLLQAIRMPDHRYDQYVHSVDFIQQYIFPGGFLPSLGAICGSIGRVTDLQPILLEDMTADYADTLMYWRLRFLERIDKIREMGYAEEFLRLWEYYLAYCETGFREKLLADAQIVFAKPECDRRTLSL
jgi:cyclopropane-fatty-acyl-phospholipid synthase